MASNTSFYVSIFVSFQALWLRFLGLFNNKWSVDNQPNDVEAAITSGPSPRLEIIESKKGLSERNLATVLDKVASPTPQNGSIDTDIGMKCKINGAVQFTIEDSEGEDSHRKSVRYDHPSRQPSRRQSSVDPMKTRILEDTLRHVQDKALDVQKTVVITPGTVFPVECSAQVEYYHGPIAEACSVKVEYYAGPVAEACSAQVEYNGSSKGDCQVEELDNSSFTVVEESGASYFEDPTAVVDVKDLPTREADDAEHMNVTSKIDSYLDKLQGTLASFKAPPSLLPEQPSLKSDASAPWLKKKHRVQFAMYSEEVPFTPAPERTSRRHRERREKKRNDLFDILSQFPDIPAFIPTCPPGRTSPGTQIPEDMSAKYTHQTPTNRQSTSSSDSNASTSSYGNSFSKDSEPTSAPWTPESGSRSYSVAPVIRAKLGVCSVTEDGSFAVSPRSYVAEQSFYLPQGNSSPPLVFPSSQTLFNTPGIDTPTSRLTPEAAGTCSKTLPDSQAIGKRLSSPVWFADSRLMSKGVIRNS